MRNLFVFVLTAFLSSAQPAEENVDRVLQAKHTGSVQTLQELATVVRSITDIRQAFLDPAQKTFTLRAAAGQAKAAEWLFSQLDQPANQQTNAEFSMEGGDLVRVFYLTNPASNAEVQEIATVARSTGELRRLFVYSPHKAIVVRGSAADMALAAWLLQELDQPADRPGFAPRVNEYRLAGNDVDVLQVFYLAHARTMQRLQEIALLRRRGERR